MAAVRSSRPAIAQSTGARPALELVGFGVAFGDRVVLAQMELELPAAGFTVLVGPAGGGKSTLLRTLAGLNDAHPSLATWGEIRLQGVALPWDGKRHNADVVARPTLVVQHARFFLDTIRQNLVSALPDRAEHDRARQSQIVAAALADNGLAHLAEQLERDAVTLPLADQRCLAIVRALLARPQVLFADEPTAGLDDVGAARVIDVLRGQAERRSVVLVTHHQRQAQLAGGRTVLLANGRIAEAAPTSQFFSLPQTELGRLFVESGSCPSSAPRDERAESVSSSVEAQPPAPPPSEPRPRPARMGPARRPSGFCWVKPGRLGGLPRPGIVDALEEDLDGLRALGVDLLVTLEERRSVDPLALAAVGIESVHFPIVDMQAPDADAALGLCQRVRAWLNDGRVVAMHCLAGHGRTGTMLASQLIFDGQGAREALEHVRAINPRLVQSEAQVAFLKHFGGAVARAAAADRAVAPTGT